MNKLKVFIFSTSMVSTMAFASGPGLKPIAPNLHPQCVTNPNDPYEPRVRMATGPDAGICVNSTLRRSVMKLSDAEAAKYFRPSDGKIVVANFSHQNKYWIAQIPLWKMTAMVLQSEQFPMVDKPISIEIHHTQVRFDFSEPIVLITQPTNEPREKITLHHLILSEENIGPYGEAFNFFNGARGYFNVAYRVVSLEDKYNWMIGEQGHTVAQRNFSLSKSQQIDFLLEGIKRGTTYGSGRAYDSFTLNCSTEILDILNTTLGTGKYEGTGFYSNLLPKILEKQGLLTREIMPTFNVEYNELRD